MKNLVIRYSGKNYPEEYLVARLRARLYNRYPEMGEREILWVHANMNNNLVYLFYPFFVIIELKRVIAILRYKLLERETRDIGVYLENSLLSKELRAFLLKADSIKRFKEGLPHAFAVLDQYVLKRNYEYPGEMEDEIWVSVINYLLKNTKQKTMKNFIRAYIDQQNIKQAYKIMKWQLQTRQLIDGGFYDKSIFIKMIEMSALDLFYDFLSRHLGENFKETDLEILDILLAEKMLIDLRKYLFEDNTAGFILYYLWYCYYSGITR
jgi:hypothetical protein